MKKILALTLSAILCLGLLAGCGTEGGTAATDPASEPTSGATNTPGGELETITVGASSTPHAEILDAVSGELEALGYDLEVVVFNDYVQPNTALADGDLDANYFQHEPYRAPRAALTTSPRATPSPSRTTVPTRPAPCSCSRISAT